VAGRRAREAGQAAGPSRLERLLFRVMGPPQLGDPAAPSTVAHDPAADLCHRCGAAWDEHPRVRTANRSYATCPEPDRARG
jgi:hypothetical protein